LESVEAPRHVCLNKKFSVACGTIYSCLPLVLVAETTERSHFNPTRIITGWRALGEGGCGDVGEPICAPKYDGLCLCISTTQTHTSFGLFTKRRKNPTGDYRT